MKLYLRDDAYWALATTSRQGMSPGTRLTGGGWEIEVDEETMRALDKARLVGETRSEAIIRLVEEAL